MHTDDRTVSSYGIGNNAIVALRMANVSEPDLRPSLRQTLLTVGPSRRQTLLNSRPEKWLEDKAAGLKSAKDSILSDEVKLVQKWSTLPAGIHNSPLERLHDNRQASEDRRQTQSQESFLKISKLQMQIHGLQSMIKNSEMWCNIQSQGRIAELEQQRRQS